jgi:hypothetical protein
MIPAERIAATTLLVMVLVMIGLTVMALGG